MRPTSLVNGSPGHAVSVTDRGFLYGDGVFETMLVSHGHVSLIDAHIDRLSEGCRRLGLPCVDPDLIKADLSTLADHDQHGVFRVQVTAGSGGRGYARPSQPATTRVSALYPLPPYPRHYWEHGIPLHLCGIRLSRQPLLAGLKHCNRLEYIVARREWDDVDIPEGLILDEDGHVAEGTMTNTFAVRGDTLMTPALDDYGVAGIMRGRILSLALSAGYRVAVGHYPLAAWLDADEVFMTNSVIGVWPVRRIGHTPVKPGAGSRQLRLALKQAGVGLERLLEGAA